MALVSSLPADPPVNVLVFTPTPTHPTIQGNRQRVLDMCRAMQSMGAEITVLYYSTEGIAAAAARQMREIWGNVEVIFPRGFAPRRTLVRYPAIDDWYDDDISDAVRRLCAQRRFDVCVVNYAWYTKLFDAVPGSAVRVVDAHDVFGARAEYFREIGRDPEWFHTSVAQEKIGLDRADFVVAIQDVEAELFRQRTRSPVSSIGFLSPANFLPLRARGAGDPLTVGYIGSANPFNVASMLAFAEAARQRPQIGDEIVIHIAGLVCKALDATRHPFLLKGVVASITDFYRSVDVVINPMLGGTGLKIKSLEALSFGKPLVATEGAMTGISSDHPGHGLTDHAQLLDRLVLLAQQPDLLATEASVSRRVFRSYHQLQTSAFLALWSEITAAVAARRRQLVTTGA